MNIRIVSKGSNPPSLEVDGVVVGRASKVTTTAGDIADLASQWSVRVVRAVDPSRRRKIVERNAQGQIVAVHDEAAT